MSVITVRLGEALPLEIKRRLVTQLTSAAVDVLGESPAAVTVLIEEIARENWSEGGVLRVDAQPSQEDVARRALEAFFKKPSAVATKAPAKTPEKTAVAKTPPRKAPAKSQRRR